MKNSLINLAVVESSLSVAKRFRVVAVVSAACIGFAPLKSLAEDIVLWNKLGSDLEIQLSEIGPGGIITGNDYAYEKAQFGNGYVRKAVVNPENNWLEFPDTILDSLRERGTIALWINPKVSNPVPYVYGFFPLIGTPNAPYPSERGRVWLIWGDGVTGRGFVGGVNFGDTVNGSITAQTSNEPKQFVATPGVPFHAAVAWDINGIDGTEDTVRVYRDGVVVGRTTNHWVRDGTRKQTIMLGNGPDSEGFDKYIVDNIVIWDYAKTDFSDRFYESPLSQSFSNLVIPRANINFGPALKDDSISLQGTFELGADSNGIDPVSEQVAFQLGAVSIVVPAGNFIEKSAEEFQFGGVINEIRLQAHIQLTDVNKYEFWVRAEQVNFDQTTIPLNVNFTIGDDFGKSKLNQGKVRYEEPRV